MDIAKYTTEHEPNTKSQHLKKQQTMNNKNRTTALEPALTDLTNQILGTD